MPDAAGGGPGLDAGARVAAGAGALQQDALSAAAPQSAGVLCAGALYLCPRERAGHFRLQHPDQPVPQDVPGGAGGGCERYRLSPRHDSGGEIRRVSAGDHRGHYPDRRGPGAGFFQIRGLQKIWVMPTERQRIRNCLQITVMSLKPFSLCFKVLSYRSCSGYFLTVPKPEGK